MSIIDTHSSSTFCKSVWRRDCTSHDGCLGSSADDRHDGCASGVGSRWVVMVDGAAMVVEEASETMVVARMLVLVL